MKKIMTFALVALIMGVFSVNANAQKTSQKNVTDWNKEVASYETAVKTCLGYFNSMKNDGKDAQDLVTKFNDSLKTAESIGLNLEKNRAQLSRTLVRRYETAKQSLSVVYQKGQPATNAARH